MNKPTPPLNLPDSTPELALRFGAILAGLVGLVARRFLRMPHLMLHLAAVRPSRADGAAVCSVDDPAGADQGRARANPAGR